MKVWAKPCRHRFPSHTLSGGRKLNGYLRVDGQVIKEGGAMEILVKIDDSRRGTRSVYMNGRCIRAGLSQGEADALLRTLLDEEFRRPRL
jgi:hypothetical protein